MTRQFSKDDPKTYSRLNDLEPETISPGSTKRLEYVLESLSKAEELSGDLVWQSKLWPHVTVEELLGALIEADRLLEGYRELEHEYEYDEGYDYDVAYRLR